MKSLLIWTTFLFLMCLAFGLVLSSCGDDDDDDNDAGDDDTGDDDNVDDDVDDDSTDDDADDDSDDDTGDDDADDDTVDDDTVEGPTWSNFAEQFFADYCTRCHSSELTGPVARNFAPAGVNYDTYDEAVEDAPGAKARASDSTGMPKGNPKPTTEERAMLGEWVAAETPF